MTDNIAVIGAGMMGSAIVKSLLKSGYPSKITAADFQLEKIEEIGKLGVAVTADNRKASAKADIIFICVKPGDVEKVLKEITQRGKRQDCDFLGRRDSSHVFEENHSRSQDSQDRAKRCRSGASFLHGLLL